MIHRPWAPQGASRRGARVAQRRLAFAAIAVGAVLQAAAVGAQALAATPAAAPVAAPPRVQAITTAAPLSLKQAIDAAWARQPEARAIGHRRDAAAASMQVARHWTPEPMALELSVKSDRMLSSHGGRELVAGLSAPLWLPGERDRSQALALAEQLALDGRLAAARWRTAGAVREAWWAAQFAPLDVAVVEARLASLRQLAADVARRVKAGDLARADQHQADGAVASAEADLATATAARVLAMQALRSVLGAMPDADLAAAPEAAPVVTGDQWLSGHPLLRALQDQVEIARRTRDLARVQTRAHPELAVQATRDRGAFGEPYGQSITVGVRIPFGTDDRGQAKVAHADAEQIEAETLLANERQRLAAEADAAAARLAAARQVAEAADRRAVLAREARGFYAKSFGLGQTDLPTRLRIDHDAAEAERQAVRARMAVAQAVSAWRQALGLLPE